MASPSDTPAVPTLVDGLFRRSAGRITAVLARRLGAEQLDLAEEAVQDALLRALDTWPHRGVPENPEGWLMQVARNRALDLVRRDATQIRVLQALQRAPAEPEWDSPGAAEDELRLLLLCLHPALSPRARVALALKTVGGFGVGEIARALLARSEAVAQLLVRSKRTIRARGLSLDLPAGPALDTRLESALHTVYLLFNEGYSATTGEQAIREDLCLAAIRFAELLSADPATARPESHALLALLYFQGSRLAARTSPAGDLLLLDHQDRSLWDRRMIDAGLRALHRATAGDRLTAWHAEAAIASCHALAARAEDTDWSRVLALYDQLIELKPSPVARLGRAVALGRVEGPGAALAELDRIAAHPALHRYFLQHAVRAEFLSATGDQAGAATCLRRALTLAGTEPERRLLRERLESWEPSG